MTKQEIDQLQQQRKEKVQELKGIYQKLSEVGAVSIPDDILEDVTGGAKWVTHADIPNDGIQPGITGK